MTLRLKALKGLLDAPAGQHWRVGCDGCGHPMSARLAITIRELIAEHAAGCPAGAHKPLTVVHDA